MQEIAELERRITAALERIGRGLDSRQESPGVAGEVATLRAALEDERMVNAQLQERLRVIKERASPAVAPPPAEADARVDVLMRQLDQQGLELQRMRQTTAQLREQLRSLREAAEAQVVEPQMINRAMMAELDALRADRAADIAELDEILAELSPLIAEVHPDARA
jgi:DNA repair exonuclease SbcCD ATPase subunit